MATTVAFMVRSSTHSLLNDCFLFFLFLYREKTKGEEKEEKEERKKETICSIIRIDRLSFKITSIFVNILKRFGSSVVFIFEKKTFWVLQAPNNVTSTHNWLQIN